MANKFKLDGLLENKIEGETNLKSYEPSQPVLGLRVWGQGLTIHDES